MDVSIQVNKISFTFTNIWKHYKLHIFQISDGLLEIDLSIGREHQVAIVAVYSKIQRRVALAETLE